MLLTNDAAYRLLNEPIDAYTQLLIQAGNTYADRRISRRHDCAADSDNGEV